MPDTYYGMVIDVVLFLVQRKGGPVNQSRVKGENASFFGMIGDGDREGEASQVVATRVDVDSGKEVHVLTRSGSENDERAFDRVDMLNKTDVTNGALDCEEERRQQDENLVVCRKFRHQGVFVL